MDDMWPVINEFLTESYENLDQLDQDLVDLEAHPGESSLLASIFRTIHTIKGTCGFLGFSKLESVAHVGENLLSKLRDGELEMTPEIASTLLAMVDAIRQILSCIENQKNEGDVDYTELVETLTRLQSGESPLDATPVHSSPDTSPETSSEMDPAANPESLFARLGGHAAVDAMVDRFYEKVLADPILAPLFAGVDMTRQRAKEKEFLTYAFGGAPNYDGKTIREAHAELNLTDAHFDTVMGHLGTTLQELGVAPDLIAEAMNIAESTRDAVLGHDLVAPKLTVPKADLENVPEFMPEPAPAEIATERLPMEVAPQVSTPEHNASATAEPRPEARGAGAESIRVDVDLLDTLMNLVGELVLARNQIMQFSTVEHDPTFVATTQHLNQLTSELQEGVMKTRMQPIGNIWSKFPRLVRDLAVSCGKQVRLDMEGKDTELDKTLIEAIKDPLTHIVRNSVDHGLEAPEVRRGRGKPEEGRLFLRAFHEGGQVNIEITDDGGGIDPEKIRDKALSRNLITSQQAQEMSDRELINLIFLPGFSTAAQVSNISGRGVGMDVVRTNIEKIGGTVDVQSRLGEGTTLKVKIPLTLAIIPALVVTCGGDRYAIPQVSLLELVRLEAERAQSAVETVQGAPVYRLRGHLLPLVYLHRELNLDPHLETDGAVNIVVLQADNRQFGLVVDSISDTEEIVVKPLGKQLKGLKEYAGATIMGDGRVALILDVMGLAQKARVISEANRDRTSIAARDKTTEAQGETQTLLVFSIGDGDRMAVPLSMVARLEEFRRDMLELSGDQWVVQYRGHIMPIIDLADVFGGQRQDREIMQVIVYTDQGRSVGVVVGRIIDIVEERNQIKQGSRKKGVLGSAVIQGRVTDLLDVEEVIREADPGFYDNALTTGVHGSI